MTWSTSADKHTVPQADALHAIANAIHHETRFDDPRPPSSLRPDLFIGPQRNPTAPLLEVMVEIRPPRGFHIFHVMIARQKHLDRMKDNINDL